jgi:RNA polymerase sigma factor (sigma-70 family)
MRKASFGSALQHVRRLASARHYDDLSDAELLARFVAHGEEAAFGVLLRRLGPMVMHVCRRILGQAQDAEDAFQATFLVLARKAGSIRKRASVASWLHGVAQRMALAAKAQAARRHARERRAADMRQNSDLADRAWQELQATLEHALRQVPEKYRAPLLLCYLEGKTQEEAAKQLGCPLGTVRSRLARGRERLKTVLERLGVKLSAPALAAAVAGGAASAAVPGRLLEATARAAQLLAAGAAPAAWVSVEVLALVDAGLKTLAIAKVKLIAALALIVGSLGAGAVLAAQMRGGPLAVQAEAPRGETVWKENGAAQPSAPKEGTEINISGRVLGPNGQPMRDAKLYLTHAGGYFQEPHTSPHRATTDADGCFAFRVAKTEFGDRATVLSASAKGYGVDWMQLPPDASRTNLTLRLVADDVPITGQIIDLQGQPVPGATVRVVQINAAAKENLDPWLEAAKDKKEPAANRVYRIDRQYLPRYTIAPALSATTDRNGRFALAGVGRERLVRLQLEGPTIISQRLHVFTRSMAPVAVPEREGNPQVGEPPSVITYYGADFKHPAAPTRPIVGIVRDQETKQPLANVTVRSYAREHRRNFFGAVHPVRTVTDQDGRYRLLGLPKGAGYFLAAVPKEDQPYVATRHEVQDGPGLDPVTVNIEMKRGIWIKGKITDKATGQPCQGTVEYFSMYTNPHLADYPGFGVVLMSELWAKAKADGSFRIAAVPGPGLLGVYYHHEPYLRANQRDDEFGTKEKTFNTSPYSIQFPSNYNALARIDPPKGSDAIRQDITLDPGWACTVHILNAQGQPLAGTRRIGLGDGFRWSPSSPMSPAQFVAGFNRHRRGDFIFQHLEKGLVGAAPRPTENGTTVRVRMSAGAAITGRLVDSAQLPCRNVALKVSFRANHWRFWVDYLPEPCRTDAEGQFRLGALLPGYEYRLSGDAQELRFGDLLREGQTFELGDVQLKPEVLLDP